MKTMQKIDKYIIVQRSVISKLEEIVNVRIRDGYKPIGAPFVEDRSGYGAGLSFCQAMVKYEDKN